jgi:hypothetical protein
MELASPLRYLLQRSPMLFVADIVASLVPSIEVPE